MPSTYWLLHMLVSIHASAWEATRPPVRGGAFQVVSIHASAWEATGQGPRDDGLLHVSIHASAWEATELYAPLGLRFVVSIHASAWEATWPAPQAMPTNSFQSTPPHGRRLASRKWPARPRRFNPRLRMGGDLPVADVRAHQHVSIHASAWEATKSSASLR